MGGYLLAHGLTVVKVLLKQRDLDYFARVAENLAEKICNFADRLYNRGRLE